MKIIIDADEFINDDYERGKREVLSELEDRLAAEHLLSIPVQNIIRALSK
ncbi:MAG: hypothetical protein WC307_06220 [Candidatus Nanoarchaeia archaeon]|jgi:hypothetical protein